VCFQVVFAYSVTPLQFPLEDQKLLLEPDIGNISNETMTHTAKGNTSTKRNYNKKGEAHCRHKPFHLQLYKSFQLHQQLLDKHPKESQ